MWFNGFLVAIDGALAQMADPVLARHRDALVLGCFREDVWYLRGLGAVTQNPSLDHFCREGRRGGFLPWITRDAGARTELLARRAARAWHSGPRRAGAGGAGPRRAPGHRHGVSPCTRRGSRTGTIRTSGG
jgi:hypothetical protein